MTPFDIGVMKQGYYGCYSPLPAIKFFKKGSLILSRIYFGENGKDEKIFFAMSSC